VLKPCTVIKGIEWRKYNVYLIWHVTCHLWLSCSATSHHNSPSATMGEGGYVDCKIRSTRSCTIPLQHPCLVQLVSFSLTSFERSGCGLSSPALAGHGLISLLFVGSCDFVRKDSNLCRQMIAMRKLLVHSMSIYGPYAIVAALMR
jgi:hypothetical protein